VLLDHRAELATRLFEDEGIDHKGAGLVAARDESGRWLTPTELAAAKAKGRAYFVDRFGSVSLRHYPRLSAVQSEVVAAE
jgi:hypothetical protein